MISNITPYTRYAGQQLHPLFPLIHPQYSHPLCQLLLDEERAEVGQLPGAGSGQDSHLNQGPSDDTGVGSFRLITEFGLTFPLEHLLSPDILQPTVEILHLLDDVLDLALVFRLDLAGLSDGHVQSHLDSTRGGTRQPAAGRGTRIGGHTDPVLAGISGGEGEATGVAITLGDNAVIVVEGLVDGNEHLQAGINGVRVRLLVDDLRGEGSDNQCVLGKLLEEAFGLTSIDIEVEGVDRHRDAQDGAEGQDGG